MHRVKIRSITAACKINDRIFSALLMGLRQGKFETERDISGFIDSQIRKAGARKAFPTIVAIGKNAVDWHHRPANSKLAEGGFCVIDFGARVNRYCSDMTRTIRFGKATAKEKGIYAKVLKANMLCIKKTRAGVGGHEIYLYSRKILGSHARFFGHGLGHGLKKIIHAHPRLSRKHRHSLREGDIITIEPGIYIPHRMGIRIEDSVLVKANGFEVLTKSPKKLIEVSLQK
ncbi:Xaa-Pro dipeptidase [uncultured archaeon]|nr:Xaa-Pro dipeptidase [uncultured archaeon]